MTPTFLLDSWAVLAYLKRETPADLRIISLLEQAGRGEARLLISVINLGKVYYSVGKARGKDFADQVLAELRLMPFEVLPADENIVFSAARWKMRCPISYADAFAAATAEQFDAVLVTGDPELTALKDQLHVEALERS